MHKKATGFAHFRVLLLPIQSSRKVMPFSKIAQSHEVSVENATCSTKVIMITKNTN